MSFRRFLPSYFFIFVQCKAVSCLLKTQWCQRQLATVPYIQTQTLSKIPTTKYMCYPQAPLSFCFDYIIT